MKTVEEKAKECIDNLIDSLSLDVNYEESNYDARQMHALSDYGKEIYKVGFLEGQSNPKIKQLEWKEDSKETRWYCDLPIGSYIIDTIRKYESYRLRFYLSDCDYLNYERFCKTIEEAMMSAQSDFEQRVKECLIIE